MTTLRPQSSDWQQEVKRAIRSPQRLLQRLGLLAQFQDQLAKLEKAGQDFPVFVPEPYLQRIEPQNAHDPLLRQVLPLPDELDDLPGFQADPVNDLGAIKAPGVLQKYHGRVLLVVNSVCAVHCRYCFRRHFPYSENSGIAANWDHAVSFVSKNKDISEVILSGGDPLMLTDVRLQELFGQLAQIPTVRTIRLHTRVPVMIPERISPALLDLFSSSRCQVVMVVHVNHGNEIDDPVRVMFRKLKSAVSLLLNQSVLLRGVNDSGETLSELSTKLIANGVLPYYLHQLDRVAGAGHFEVPVERGKELIGYLRNRLPGYAVPKYVIEEPGERHKISLD
ncbi:MAG: EF-P beta-lysylation protein EpmB [Pirellulaceae bacterium]